jgi:hypothetical protein
MDVIPVDDDDTYTRHISLIILGWVILTLIVAAGLAIVSIVLIG